MNKKTIIIISAILVVWIGVIGFFVVKSSVSKKETASSTSLYTIPNAEKIFINGVVVPRDSKDFYQDPTKGDVSKISVENGQYVDKGDLLITYKNEQISSQIEDLKLQLESLEKQKNQVPVVPGIPQDTSSAVQVEQLKKQVSSLKKKEYSSVYAPFSGKVYIDSNDNIQQNQVLLTLQAMDFYVKGQVSEKDLPKIKLRQNTDVLILSTRKTKDGKISSISDRPISQDIAMPTNQNQSLMSYYNVDIKFENQDDLTNGFHVQATVKLYDKEIKIPSSSLIKENNKVFVYKVIDNKLNKQNVTIGQKEGNSTVVKSGLKENDVIVKNPTKDTKEGQEIE